MPDRRGSVTRFEMQYTDKTTGELYTLRASTNDPLFRHRVETRCPDFSKCAAAMEELLGTELQVFEFMEESPMSVPLRRHEDLVSYVKDGNAKANVVGPGLKDSNRH
jgi:hypothetical protein